MSEIRNINYQSKDFAALRNQLIEFAKNYFPDTYSDFTVASPGMMFMEMAAYVGDILSFYQDIQLQETFLEFAKNPKNLFAIAYMMGYRPKVTNVAEAELTVQQIVDAVRDAEGNYGPNWTQVCKLPEYTQVHSSAADNSTFLFRDAVDFSYSSSNSPTFVEIAEFQADTDIPSKYVLTKTVKAFSGEIKSYCHYFGPYEKFPTLELPDNNIVGIVTAYNAENPTEVWTEVPTLGQDTVFVEEKNEMANEDGTSYILSVKKVPNRFVTRFRTNGKLQIQFGAGINPEDSVGGGDETSILPNPTNLAPQPDEYIVNGYDKAYDPSNFMFSKSYGVVPTNMKMIFEYIVGGGLSANVPANTLTDFEHLTKDRYSYPNASGAEIPKGVPQLFVTNRAAASGGSSGDSLEEVRQNALKAFAEQKRVVTLKDFAVRSLSMPQKFGTISKVLAVKSRASESILDNNPLAITLYVLGQNMDGKLQKASNTVKENLKTYLSEYMMITDAIDIKDAYVINFKVQYEIVLRPGFSADSVLYTCSREIEKYFSLDRRSINQPILLSELSSILDQVQGVQTVKSLKIINVCDREAGYSEYSYDIEAATRDGVVYPSYDPCIFELRYPEVDIIGRVTNY